MDGFNTTVVLEGDGLIVELIRHSGVEPRNVAAPGVTDPVLAKHWRPAAGARSS